MFFGEKEIVVFISFSFTDFASSFVLIVVCSQDPVQRQASPLAPNQAQPLSAPCGLPRFNGPPLFLGGYWMGWEYSWLGGCRMRMGMRDGVFFCLWEWNKKKM